jgi:hypothetical protein
MKSAADSGGKSVLDRFGGANLVEFDWTKPLA